MSWTLLDGLPDLRHPLFRCPRRGGNAGFQTFSRYFRSTLLKPVSEPCKLILLFYFLIALIAFSRWPGLEGCHGEGKGARNPRAADFFIFRC